MTVIPPGAQLAPVDLPPPPPSADPREPSPSAIRGRSSRTPQRARSPGPYHSPTSRGSSPSRPPPVAHHSSSDASIPIVHPVPKHATSLPLPSHAPIHLSRPSSPASIHSSSSAIFERDIELPAVGNLSIGPAPTQTLSHKSSRLSQFSHGSALDHTVPAVLDDAVEALQGQGTTGGIEGVEIEAPVAPAGVGMTRQSSASVHGIGSGRKISTGGLGGLGSLGSRSPSPSSVGSLGSAGIASPARSPPILSQLATQHQTGSVSPSGSSPTSLMSGVSGVPRPTIPQRTSTGPQLPGGWAFGHDKPSEVEAHEPIGEPVVTSPPSLQHAPSAPAAIPSHLTPTKDKRRISYISYNDLLLSVPTSVTPLGEITSGATSPDHLPGNISPSVPSLSPVMASSVSSASQNASSTSKEVDPKANWDAGASGRTSGLGVGEGEWEREGLGKGLEQRLEDLVKDDGTGGSATPR